MAFTPGLRTAGRSAAVATMLARPALVTRSPRSWSILHASASLGAPRRTEVSRHQPLVVGLNRSRRPSIRRHALAGKLLHRLPVLGKIGEPHAAQHIRCLGELDVVVADDLDAVAPWVEEIEKLTG